MVVAKLGMEAAKAMATIATPAARTAVSGAARSITKALSTEPMKALEKQGAQPAANLFAASVFQMANRYAQQGRQAQASAQPFTAQPEQSREIVPAGQFAKRAAAQIANNETRMVPYTGHAAGQPASTETRIVPYTGGASALTTSGAKQSVANAAAQLVLSEAGSMILDKLSSHLFGADRANESLPDPTPMPGRRMDALRMTAGPQTGAGKPEPTNMYDAAGSRLVAQQTSKGSSASDNPPGQTANPTTGPAPQTTGAAPQPEPPQSQSGPRPGPQPEPARQQAQSSSSEPNTAADPNSGVAPEKMTAQQARDYARQQEDQDAAQDILDQLERSKRNRAHRQMLDEIADSMARRKALQDKLGQSAGY